jgi:hypothetical protein
VYGAGGIPCRIQHGTYKMRLQWDTPPSELSYDPLLITCFEGLLETEHPFSFVAREAAKELLQAENAAEKTVPLVARLVMPLRLAFMNKEKKIFEAALESLKLLSELIGPHLNSHLHLILQQINKRMGDRTLRDKIIEVLTTLEDQGGEEVVQILRAKIPTYRV